MVKCPDCGRFNPDGIAFCRGCGSEMPHGPEGQSIDNAKPRVDSLACPHCGAELASDRVFCPDCGKDPNPTMTPLGPDQHSLADVAPGQRESGVLITGATLALVNGSIHLSIGLMLIGGALEMWGLIPVADSPLGFGVAFALVGLGSIVGGLFALMRKHSALMILGVASCMVVGLITVIGFVMGLLAMALIAISNDEFDD